MSIGNKKEALIRAIKNSKCCCNKDSSDEQGGGTINYDELAEKFRNFYIYPKKDKAKFFQDGMEGEYDVNLEIAQAYKNIANGVSIDGGGYESFIIGTASVEDYFEVSDIEVLKLLATVISYGFGNSILKDQTDTSKLFVDYSTSSSDGLAADVDPNKEIHDVSIRHFESGETSTDYPYFGVVLTPEDYTKFYVFNLSGDGK